MRNLICEEFNPTEAGTYCVDVEGMRYCVPYYLTFDGVNWTDIPDKFIGKQIWWYAN